MRKKKLLIDGEELVKEASVTSISDCLQELRSVALPVAAVSSNAIYTCEAVPTLHHKMLLRAEYSEVQGLDRLGQASYRDTWVAKSAVPDLVCWTWIGHQW